MFQEAMKKLKERYKNSVVENPLIEHVRRLFEDSYSIGQLNCKNLLSRTKNLSLDIRENEEKRFSMFNRQKISFIQRYMQIEKLVFSRFVSHIQF